MTFSWSTPDLFSQNPFFFPISVGQFPMLVEIHIVLLQSQTSKFCGKHLFLKHPRKKQKYENITQALALPWSSWSLSLAAHFLRIYSSNSARGAPLAGGGGPPLRRRSLLTSTSAGHPRGSFLAMGQNPIVHHKTAGTCGCSSQIISPCE